MKRLVIVLALVAAVMSNMALGRWYGALFVGPQRDATAVSVMLDALGELRTFLAQDIWFEIDIYHHQMEREGIHWTQERDLMSMYRMVTTLDPRFVEAYDVGSYQLVENFHLVGEGLEYLDEGLRNNPDSALLHFNKAFLMYYLKRYKEAATEAGYAMALYAPDPAALLQMSGPDQIPFLNALRIFAHAERMQGDKITEVHALRIWLTVRPGDDYPIRRLKELNEAPAGYTPEQYLNGTRIR